MWENNSNNKICSDLIELLENIWEHLIHGKNTTKNEKVIEKCAKSLLNVVRFVDTLIKYDKIDVIFRENFQHNK